MKINVVSHNKLGGYQGLVRELKRRNLYDANSNEVVINIDPCVGLFTEGDLTILWEADDFLNIGKAHYDHLSDKVDIRYIQHPEYLKYYPEGTRVLRVAFDDYYKDLPRKKKYDYITAGSMELIPLYYPRIKGIDSLRRQVPLTLIGDTDYENFLRKMATGRTYVDFLPHNPDNNLKSAHITLYEALAFCEVIFEEEPILDHLKGLNRKDILERHTWKNRVDQLLKEI